MWGRAVLCCPHITQGAGAELIRTIAALRSAAPHCITPHRTALHRTALHRTTPHCTALHYSAVQRTTPHMRCAVRGTVYCNLQGEDGRHRDIRRAGGEGSPLTAFDLVTGA